MVSSSIGRCFSVGEPAVRAGLVGFDSQVFDAGRAGEFLEFLAGEATEVPPHRGVVLRQPWPLAGHSAKSTLLMTSELAVALTTFHESVHG
ncbi:hypothetical protein [Nocardia cyriacigeorgica]|uniref:hypothetical protein n=1 Tax=Nocardia cyriacigeorgica TaxID=135487 RepID=UPI001486B4AC|nr:hypothetical protein [Nocardia cyriacigeorgica]